MVFSKRLEEKLTSNIKEITSIINLCPNLISEEIVDIGGKQNTRSVKGIMVEEGIPTGQEEKSKSPLEKIKEKHKHLYCALSLLDGTGELDINPIIRAISSNRSKKVVASVIAKLTYVKGRR
jgi:hypothetical protein